MAKSDKKYRVGKSKIQGDGAFAKQTLNPGDYIGKVHTINKLYEDYDFTELGKKHNHSEDPNVQNVLIGNERHLIAIKPIKKGQELTSDYRLQPDLEQPNQDFEKAKNGKKTKTGGWLDAYDAPQAQNGIEGTMGGLTDKGFNYNPAWGGAWKNGGKKSRGEKPVSPEGKKKGVNYDKKSKTWKWEGYTYFPDKDPKTGKEQGWTKDLDEVTVISNKPKGKTFLDGEFVYDGPTYDLQYDDRGNVVGVVGKPGQINFVEDIGLNEQGKKFVESIMNRHYYEKPVERYEPSDAVKNTKAALAAGAIATMKYPPAQYLTQLAGATGDFYTGTRYAFDKNWSKAGEDYVQGLLGLIPYSKASIGMKGDVYLSPLQKLYNAIIGGAKIGSDVKTISEAIDQEGTSNNEQVSENKPYPSGLGSYGMSYIENPKIEDYPSGKGAHGSKYQVQKNQNGGTLQPPMAGAVQTVPMAQNGSNIGTRPEDEDIREIYKWEKEYTNSPRFAYLSSKQGDSPEITQRRRDVINKFNIDEDIVRVPDGVSYVGDEGDGLKFYLSPDAGDWPSYSDINAHEIGHFPYNTGELNFPESTYNEIQARNKEFQKMKASGITNDDVEHDVSPNEVRADKNQLLYQMKKLGIYDATKDGDVTPEQLDKFKKSGQWNRLQRLYNDDDILWLINNVAQNTSGVSDKAFMGASIPGSTGFTYARTQGAAPSEGPYAKKTMPSAQDGELLTFEREEPFRPTSVEEPSALLSMDYLKSFVPEYKRLTGVPNRANDMYDRMYTDLVHKKGMDPMKGAYITSFLQENYDPFGNLKRYRPTTPETDYTDEERMESRRREKEAAERNKKVAGKLGEDYLKNGGMAYYQAGLDFKPKTISRDGSSVNRADENPLQKLDDLLNFTNYNKPKAKSGGWLDKYN